MTRAGDLLDVGAIVRPSTHAGRCVIIQDAQPTIKSTKACVLDACERLGRCDHRSYDHRKRQDEQQSGDQRQERSIMTDVPVPHFLNEIRTTFANRPAATAIDFADESCTFSALEQKAHNSAAWLNGLGVARGDRVLIATAEKKSFLAAHLGAIFAGAVVLPVNPKFTRDEVRHALLDSSARIAIAGREARAVIESLQAEGNLPELRAVVDDADAWNAPVVRDLLNPTFRPRTRA